MLCLELYCLTTLNLVYVTQYSCMQHFSNRPCASRQSRGLHLHTVPVVDNSAYACAYCTTGLYRVLLHGRIALHAQIFILLTDATAIVVCTKQYDTAVHSNAAT
jgi:hypothetical protein